MLPLEFLAEQVVAPLKGLIAHELAARGYSQSRIGLLLGISQPAVSAYLKLPKESYLERLGRAGIGSDKAEWLARTFTQLVESAGIEEALKYVNDYLLSLLASLQLCEFHRRQHPQLASCEICKNIRIESETASRVEMAFRMLEQCAKCHRLVPKVLMNLVELGPAGVVGYPGRIYVEGGRLRVKDRPRPGASRFLAALLAAVRQDRPEFKAVANIALNAEVAACVSRLLKAVQVGPSNSEMEIIENVAVAMASSPVDCVMDLGGHGIEPNCYIFGSDAVEVATKVKLVADCLP